MQVEKIQCDGFILFKLRSDEVRQIIARMIWANDGLLDKKMFLNHIGYQAGDEDEDANSAFDTIAEALEKNEFIFIPHYV